jgi:hypothetical protein
VHYSKALTGEDGFLGRVMRGSSTHVPAEAHLLVTGMESSGRDFAAVVQGHETFFVG